MDVCCWVRTLRLLCVETPYRVTVWKFQAPVTSLSNEVPAFVLRIGAWMFGRPGSYLTPLFSTVASLLRFRLGVTTVVVRVASVSQSYHITRLHAPDSTFPHLCIAMCVCVDHPPSGQSCQSGYYYDYGNVYLSGYAGLQYCTYSMTTSYGSRASVQFSYFNLRFSDSGASVTVRRCEPYLPFLAMVTYLVVCTLCVHSASV